MHHVNKSLCFWLNIVRQPYKRLDYNLTNCMTMNVLGPLTIIGIKFGILFYNTFIIL